MLVYTNIIAIFKYLSSIFLAILFFLKYNRGRGGEMKESGENYLENIYFLSLKKEIVKSGELAKIIGVSRPSVFQALTNLKKAGLIEKEYYGGIKLTDAGRKKAMLLAKKHYKITNFLKICLGISEETAERDACRIEHVISEETMKAIEAYLKDNDK